MDGEDWEVLTHVWDLLKVARWQKGRSLLHVPHSQAANPPPAILPTSSRDVLEHSRGRCLDQLFSFHTHHVGILEVNSKLRTQFLLVLD